MTLLPIKAICGQDPVESDGHDSKLEISISALHCAFIENAEVESYGICSGFLLKDHHQNLISMSFATDKSDPFFE